MGDRRAPSQEVLRGVLSKPAERAASEATCDCCPICNAVGFIPLSSVKGAGRPILRVVLELEDVGPTVPAARSGGQTLVAPSDARLLLAGRNPGN